METWNVKLKFCYMHNILRFLRARQTLVETDKLGTLIMVDSNENKCSKKKFSCTFFLIYVSKVFFLSNSSPMSKVQTSVLGQGFDFVFSLSQQQQEQEEEQEEEPPTKGEVLDD